MHDKGRHILSTLNNIYIFYKNSLVFFFFFYSEKHINRRNWNPYYIDDIHLIADIFWWVIIYIIFLIEIMDRWTNCVQCPISNKSTLFLWEISPIYLFIKRAKVTMYAIKIKVEIATIYLYEKNYNFSRKVLKYIFNVRNFDSFAHYHIWNNIRDW